LRRQLFKQVVHTNEKPYFCALVCTMVPSTSG
jgi:hypothetical protein